MSFEIAKSLHIIFVVTWFAGLFYFVRLLIYHVEALQKDETEKRILINQFEIMEKRLWYGITWPSAVFTLIFGGHLLKDFLPLKDHPWLISKLCFVVGLYLYHFLCGSIYKKLKNGVKSYSSQFLRIWNEVATLFLFSIVFLVELQTRLAFGYGLLALMILAIVLMLSIRIYKRVRKAP
ncbi:MAG: CopD family protein [Bacteriovoracaceae bacterium]